MHLFCRASHIQSLEEFELIGSLVGLAIYNGECCFLLVLPVARHLSWQVLKYLVECVPKNALSAFTTSTILLTIVARGWVT